MKKDFSPEERLLRLIKKSKKEEAPKKEEVEKIELQRPPIMAQADKGLVKASAILLPSMFKKVNTHVLNSLLVIILAAILLYFIGDFLYTSFYKEETGSFKEFQAAPAPKAVEEKEKALDVKPYSFYSSSIEGRNIFLPQEVETEAVFTGPTIEEISANLSLIGIIAGDRPQAIIEDKKTGKSHFLYQDGSAGKARIVEILEDSVVVEYQGERFELVL